MKGEKRPVPTSRTLAALARTTHLLQLHFIVFWGFFAGTSRAFMSSSVGGGGCVCPLRGCSTPLGLLRARTSASLFGSTSDTQDAHKNGKLRAKSLRLRSSGLAPVTGPSRGHDIHALTSMSPSRLYMSLSPLGGVVPSKNHPQNKKSKKQRQTSSSSSSSSLSLERALRIQRTESRQHLPEVVVIGVSHRTAPVEVREQLAIHLPEEQWNAASASLCESSPAVDEAFLLSTCNRFELYVAGKDEYEAMTDALQFLHTRTNGTLSKDMLRRHLFVLTGEDALWHLMRVSAGLDSMVLGEAQIQCQVKKAFTKSCTEEGGQSGLVLKQVLQAAITVGKRVRSETQICKGAVSVSSAAVEFTALKMKQQQVQAQELAQQQQGRQQPDVGGGSEETVLPAKSLVNSNIVILGAGKMARLLLVHLNSKKVRKVTVVNRSPQSVQKLQAEFKDMQLEYRPLQQMWGAVQTADVVYPCTSSAAPLITPDELRSCMRARQEAREEEGRGQAGPEKKCTPTECGGSGASCPISSSIIEGQSPVTLQFTPQLPLRFIDLSVPRNVHPACGAETGVECYNVDDLKEVVQENTARRQGEMGHAEDILREEVRSYRRWQESLGELPTIERLQQKAEEMRQLELKKSMPALASLSSDDLRAVDRLSRGLVGQLLRKSVDLLRNNSPLEIAATAGRVSL